MEEYTAFNIIMGSFYKTIDKETSEYHFSAALYDTWIKGNELQQRLAKRLVFKWMSEIRDSIDKEYRDHKYDLSWPFTNNYPIYFKKELDKYKIIYMDHNGILSAVEELILKN